MKFLHRFSLSLVLVTILSGPLALQAQQNGRDLARANLSSLTTQDEERDAKELADRINEALNIRREVTLVLLNDTSVVVSGRVSAQRYWLVITAPDNSEFRFRVSLIATVKIK